MLLTIKHPYLHHIQAHLYKMFFAKYFLIFLASCFCAATAVNLPVDIKKCSITSTGETLTACLLEASNLMLDKLEKGIPELGISSVQPLKLHNFTVGEGTGIVHVAQHYGNAVIHDIIQAKVQKIGSAVITKKDIKIQLEAFASHFKLQGRYDLNGRLLLLPVFGTGDCEINLRDIKIPISIVGSISEKDGEAFVSVTEFNLKLYPKTIHYDFKNLFNGNKVLGDNINAVLNDNPLDVFNDVRKGYEDVIGKACRDVCNEIVTKVPLKTLFLP